MYVSLIFVFMLLAVILDAASDGLRLRYKYSKSYNKRWMLDVSHIAEALTVGSLIAIAWFFIEIIYKGSFVSFTEFIIYGPVWYVVCRLFLFDIVYNMVAGISGSYIGVTSVYDRILGKILQKLRMPVSYYRWVMFVGLLAYSGWLLFDRNI